MEGLEKWKHERDRVRRGRYDRRNDKELVRSVRGRSPGNVDDKRDKCDGPCEGSLWRYRVRGGRKSRNYGGRVTSED